MSSNKIVALVLVGVLAVQVLASTASAQLGPVTGPDLLVEDVDIGRPRMEGVAGKINITIRNQGNAPFRSTTGWQIFVGLNGGDDGACIERGDGAGTTITPGALAPCYIRMTATAQQPTDGSNATDIPAGETRRYTMSWTADTAMETARIVIVIGNLGSSPSESVPENCSGPDAPNCQNNVFVLSGVRIEKLGVRAIPNRQISPSPGANVNTPWKSEEITEPCPDSPVAVTRGCKVAAGRTIVGSYTVINTGTVDDTYTGSFVESLTNYSERGYVFALAPQTFSLGKAQSREVRLTIVVPENETAGTTTNVVFSDLNLRWSSVRSPAVNTATPSNPGCPDTSNPQYCANPSVPSFVVDYRRGLNATSNETWRQVTPGKQSQMNITLNNTGNAQDLYNVTIVRQGWTINDSWVPTVTAQGIQRAGANPSPTTGFLSVEKNELKNITLQVTAPMNATNGTYTFGVLMKSVGDTNGNARCKANEILSEGQCALTFTLHLGQEWRISGVTDVASRVVPGEPVTYNLGIRNEGNGYDNITLELANTVFGWDVQLSDRVARLTPFNTTTFTLSVTSPPNVLEGTVGAFFVNATSGGPQDVPFESRSKAVIESQMTILRGPNMRLDLPVNSSFVDAGASASYTLQVTNVGNVADNFTIPTPQRPSDWGVEVTPAFLELQPNQQGQVVVSLRAPSGAAVGEKATAIVKVQSTVERSREKTVSLEGRVSGPDFFVDSILVNTTSPYRGDPVEVSVVVGNAGNKGTDQNTTLRVYFVQNGVERVIGEKLYGPLAIPGQRRLVETFHWETSDIEGAGVLLARIDVDGKVPEIDESAASNEKTKAITLRTFDIKLTPAEGLSARPGEIIEYGTTPSVFVLRYDGNQANEPVTVRFESEHGWLIDSQGASVPAMEQSLTLPQGAPISVSARLGVPTIPGTGKDTLTITVVPSLRPDETLRATTTTTILDEENPKITRIVATPANAKLGDVVNITAVIEDATGVSAVTAYIVLPTNETQSLVLTKAPQSLWATLVPGVTVSLDANVWTGTKTFTIAGVHRITAEAADAASPPNLNRTRVTTGTFNLTPGSAPVIKLAAGQSTTIRTGSAIGLDITDPLGIGKVTYAIKGVSYDIRGPNFQIDTSAFAAGPVDIFVTAVNIYGVQTTTKFSFVVDNAAPKTPTLTLSPAKPRAGEQVTLTIKTESKVEAVDVLIKRDGQVVQSINATRKGIGSFEVKFDTPEGDYRLDVTARDVAGNTKLEESAVVFSARPGSVVPGPGLLVVLVALAGAVYLLRRRPA